MTTDLEERPPIPYEAWTWLVCARLSVIVGDEEGQAYAEYRAEVAARALWPWPAAKHVLSLHADDAQHTAETALFALFIAPPAVCADPWGHDREVGRWCGEQGRTRAELRVPPGRCGHCAAPLPLDEPYDHERGGL